MNGDSLYKFSCSKDFFAASFRGRGSFAVQAKRLGYKSPRLLEMVCQGKRLASNDFLYRVKNLLKLTDPEFIYLELLVRRDRELLRNRRDPLLDAEIANYSTLALDQQFVDEQSFRTVADWQFLVLKQLFRTSRRMTPTQIAKKLRGKLKIQEVKSSLSILRDLGIIHYDAATHEIRPRVTKGFISEAEVPSRAIRSHHHQMMQRAQESLEEVPVTEREIYGVTLAFSRKNLDKVKNEIRDFMNRIDSKYGEEIGDDVYQLNLQFFPHTAT